MQFMLLGASQESLGRRGEAIGRHSGWKQDNLSAHQGRRGLPNPAEDTRPNGGRTGGKTLGRGQHPASQNH